MAGTDPQNQATITASTAPIQGESVQSTIMGNISYISSYGLYALCYCLCFIVIIVLIRAWSSSNSSNKTLDPGVSSATQYATKTEFQQLKSLIENLTIDLTNLTNSTNPTNSNRCP
jgi:hypothetical protein